MGELLLFVVVALTVAAIIFGVTVMVSGGDPGLDPVEPDGRALPLPGDRPLGEEDVVRTRFDTALRGYRMSQVDQALQRAAYDIGYKGELIGVLEAEVAALREGRMADADVLRRAREAAIAPPVQEPGTAAPGSDQPAQDTAGQPVTGAVGATAVPDDPAAVVAGLPPDIVASSGASRGALRAGDSGSDPLPGDAPAARPVDEAAPVERR